MFVHSIIAVTALVVTAYAQAASTTTAPTTTVQSTSAADTTTISALVLSHLSGSIVTADACSTLIVLPCEAMPVYNNLGFCSLAVINGGTEVTYTINNSETVQAVVSASNTALSEIISIKCTASSSGPEVCTFSGSASVSGQTGVSPTSTTYTVANPASLAAVSITAGAAKLPARGSTCTSSTGAAARPTATAIVERLKILMPMGAVVAAGAALL